MRPRSEAVYKKACAVIPGGVNSPVRSFKSLGMSPLIVESGKGSVIRDVDGHEYIDYCQAWGSLILGHAHPRIVRRASLQMTKGSSFGIATEIEEEMASCIVRLIPSIEKVRFVSSGTEATMTALRLARGFTGRSKIIKFTGHYHGHSDSLLVQAGSGVASINPLATSKGVNTAQIADTLCIPFNDPEALRFIFVQHGADIAAIILEPITANMGVVLPEPGFLELLREETRRVGALLIFDEVVTGFRVGLRGAQGLYNIDPDLTCLGKIVGGGFPAAAVGGKAEIMDFLAPLGQVYQAGTLSGNPVAMRAGFETLKIAQAPGFYDRLSAKTDRLVRPLEEAMKGPIKTKVCVQRVSSMFSLFFGVEKVKRKEDLVRMDEKKFVEFFKYMFGKGIYLPPSSHEAWFVSDAHTDAQIDYTVKCVLEFLSMAY